ncbi:MAG: sensor histidine kinase [Terracidiphilus sp.]
MRQTAQAAELKQGPVAAELVQSELVATGVSGHSMTTRKRVEAMVETLANLRVKGESLAEVAHDARNMVTALGLYCDLLEEPGVLNPGFHHYAGELRLVAMASRRLVEKMLALDARVDARSVPEAGLFSAIGANWTDAQDSGDGRLEPQRRWDLMPPEPIDNLAAELAANRNLLSALAGPSITLTVDAQGGAQPVRLTGEDLTRILVNLVKNAAEAMPAAGQIAIRLHEFHAGAKHSPWLVLTVEDNGPGIPCEALETIFDSGFTTRPRFVSGRDASASGASRSGSPGNRPASHRGLGLSITRSILESTGGRIHAANRIPAGACFKIELPIRSL